MENERKLHWILTGGKCWHKGIRPLQTSVELSAEQIDGKWDGPWDWCIKCGKVETRPNNININPTYAHSDEIADLMRERGLLNAFLKWLFYRDANSNIHICHTFMMGEGIADTLLTPALLAQAIISWYEIDHKWNGGSYELR